MKNERLDHYSLPPEHVASASAEADAVRITREELPDLLARHRSRDPQAAKRLNEGYRYLVWRFYRSFYPTLRLDADAVLGELLLDLATGVKRLAKTTRVQAPDDVEPYLIRILWKTTAKVSMQGEHRIRSRDKGKKCEPLTQTIEHPDASTWTDPEQYIDILEDPQAPLPLETAGGKSYRPPSRFKRELPSIEFAEVYERWLQHATTAIERDLCNLGLAITGHGDEAAEVIISRLQGLTPRQVKAILRRLDVFAEHAQPILRALFAA